MRILAILKYIPSQSTDLKGDLLWSLIEGLEASGNEIVLLTDGRTEKHGHQQIALRYGTGLRWLDRFGNKVSKFSGFKCFEYFFLRNQVRRCVLNSLGDQHIDVMVAECTSDTPAVIAHYINQAAGIPFVVREHKNYESKRSTVATMSKRYVAALRASAAMIAVSDGQALTIRKSGVRDDLHVIENSISDGFFMPPTKRLGERNATLEKFCSEGIVFGAWTRWRKIKRLDLLLEAFARAYARNNKLRLVVAGPVEPDDSLIHEFIKTRAMEQCVYFWGFATREEIQQIAFSVSCVVVPSDYETFGLPVIEGMAAGKPAIVTRCNGPEAIVCDPRLGRVVDRGSEMELAEAMLDVAAGISEFDADFITRYAKERYSAKTIGSRYSALLAKVTSSQPVGDTS